MENVTEYSYFHAFLLLILISCYLIDIVLLYFILYKSVCTHIHAYKEPPVVQHPFIKMYHPLALYIFMWSFYVVVKSL